MATSEQYAVIGQGYSGGGGYSLERTISNGNRALNYEHFVNDDETDVAFMNNLYRGDNPDYFLGGWIIKAVTDVLLQFMGTPTPESKDKNHEKLLLRTYENNKSKIYSGLKFLGLYGQFYMELSYDQRRKLVKYRPLTKREVVEVRKENWNDPDDITFLRIRNTVEKFEVEADKKAKELDDYDNEKEYIHFDKLYWKENNPEYEEALKKQSKNLADIPEFIYYAKVIKIEDDEYTVHTDKFENPWGCIPVVEFNQGRLNGDANGFSDASGIVKLAGVYHQILERAIDTNIYNGQPTIVFTGLDDPRSFISEMYGEIAYDGMGGTQVNEGIYETLGGYYLKGNANVKYLQVTDTVSNAKQLLELLFYIFVQMSGVPEWALGASVNNTYASTKVQSNSLVQRIEGKRYDTHDSFLLLNEYTTLIHEANTGEQYEEKDSTIKWGKIIPDDDMSMDVRLSMAKEAGLLSDETYLKLLDVVGDTKAELKIASKERDEKVLQSAESLSIINSINQKLQKDEIIDDEASEMESVIDFKNISAEMVEQLLEVLGR